MYKILIADDEKSERDVILFLLKKYRFDLEYLQASNGRDAEVILTNEPVDILLTDIQMPYVNGMELAAKARDIDPDMEIIFFSGYDDFEYVKAALSLRAMNYILKPVNPKEFKKSISDILLAIKSREDAKAQSEKYIEEHFRLNNPKNNTDNSVNKNTISDEQDSKFIKNIEQSIQLKNAEDLKLNTSLILDKYNNIPNVSHIYIRYLCTTLLHLFIDALPEQDHINFTKIAEEIYTFRHFSDIRKLIESYMEKVIAQIKLESQSSRYSVHLIEQYIHSHYMEELCLNTLAGIAYLSPKYLSSMFIQVTGISVNKYIKNVRMEKALDLLLKTNMKITDICRSVGYSYESYFCKTFQEYFGITPDKYRQSRGTSE